MTSKYPNSGILKRNPSRTSDKHPHYNGGAEIGGEEYWMSAWIKNKDDGSSFMSISFEPKDKNKVADKPAAEKINFSEMLDDDVPF